MLIRDLVFTDACDVRYSEDLGKAYMKHNGMPSTAPYDPPANWVSVSRVSLFVSRVCFFCMIFKWYKGSVIHSLCCLSNHIEGRQAKE